MKYKIGILIFPQVEELDFIGPYEMITMWKEIVDDEEECNNAAAAAAAAAAKEENENENGNENNNDDDGTKDIHISPECCLIISQYGPGRPVVCSKGLSINSNVSFDECPPNHFDILIIPGGNGTTY
jgi:putative intracellular protease/amidase